MFFNSVRQDMAVEQSELLFFFSPRSCTGSWRVQHPHVGCSPLPKIGNGCREKHQNPSRSLESMERREEVRLLSLGTRGLKGEGAAPDRAGGSCEGAGSKPLSAANKSWAGAAARERSVRKSCEGRGFGALRPSTERLLAESFDSPELGGFAPCPSCQAALLRPAPPASSPRPRFKRAGGRLLAPVPVVQRRAEPRCCAGEGLAGPRVAFFPSRGQRPPALPRHHLSCATPPPRKDRAPSPTRCPAPSSPPDESKLTASSLQPSLGGGCAGSRDGDTCRGRSDGVLEAVHAS